VRWWTLSATSLTPEGARARSSAPQVFFLPQTDAGDPLGQRLCIYHDPREAKPHAALVFVHAWAEEMNKARRMVAMQARALADAGYAVLLLDLHGCGDSSGDFADASWATWLADVASAVAWMQQQCSGVPLCLWGLRAGALLATQAASQLGLHCDFLFWQPPTQGKPLLQQFMRLKAAADLHNNDAKAVMTQLRAELDAGRPIDVAGYTIAASLARGLEQASLVMPTRPSRVLWLETSTREDAALLPASQTTVQAWSAAGHQVTPQVVQGPAFWQTQEIEDAPALLAATLRGLQAWGPP
jgi:uncharacterized protein